VLTSPLVLHRLAPPFSFSPLICTALIFPFYLQHLSFKCSNSKLQQHQQQSVANKLSEAEKRDTPSRNIIKAQVAGEIIYVWLPGVLSPKTLELGSPDPSPQSSRL